MNPTTGNNSQAFYIILNAIKYPYPDSNKKFQIINDCAEKFDIPILGIDVQPLKHFMIYRYIIII